MEKNPYIVGPPVSGKSLYGRERELEFILDALEAHDQSPVLLHGQRRVGKSSILAHLQAETLPSHNIASVYLDLQHMGLQDDADSWFGQILEEFVEIFERTFEFIRPFRASDVPWDTYFVEEFAPSVYLAIDRRRLVVLVDEFDSLPDFEQGSATSDQESTAHKLMALFHNLSARDGLAICFVVVVGRQFDHLPQDIRALLKELRAQHIWLLNREITYELITKPVEKLPLHYQQKALDRIYELTQGHPFFTQAICSEIFQNLVHPERTTVTPTDVDAVVDLVFTSVSTGFAWLWADLSPSQKLILAALAEFEPGQSPASVEEIEGILREHHLQLEDLALADELAYLVEHKTLQRIDSPESPPRYQVAIELMRLWVKERNSISDLRHRIANLDPEAHQAYQRAALLYAKTDKEKAKTELEKAVQHNPYHPDAWMALGEVLQEAGNPQAAIKAYRTGYALNADHAKDRLLSALLIHAAHLEDQELCAKASAVYRDVLALEPNEAIVIQKVAQWFEKGRQAHQRKDWGEAIDFLQRVVEIDPGCRQASNLLEAARAEASQEARTTLPTVSLIERWPIFVVGGILLLLSFILLNEIIRPPGAIIGLLMPTPTITDTPSPAPTQTPRIVIWTATPTDTPTPTSTPVPPGQPTPTDTVTPTPTAPPTNTPIPTLTPTQPPEAPTYTPTPFIKVIVVTANPTPCPLPEGRAFDIALQNTPDGRHIVAVLDRKGIFRIEDGGHCWIRLWQPSDTPFVDPASFTDIAIAPTDDRYIYVAGYESVLFSHDDGTSWDLSVGALSEPGTLPPDTQVYSLAVGFHDPLLVYAATGKGAFRSRDGGQTWQALDQGLYGRFIDDPMYAIAIDPTNSDQVVYAAGKGDQILYSVEADRDPFRWRISSCAVCGSAIYALAFGPDGAVFAGGGAGKGGTVAKKEPEGTKWVLSGAGIPTAQAPDLVISNLVFAPNNPAVIYAGTGWRNNARANGIYRSLDDGATWQTMNAGLSRHENPAPWVQGIAAASDGTLFIATYDGVYQLDDNREWEAK